LSQIQPRILAWYASNDELLEMIRRGMSIYEALAIQSMDYRGEEALKKADPAMYAMAKAQVLGLGYGMGWMRFMEESAKDGIIITQVQAQDIVAGFRASNRGIVTLWNTADREFKRTANDPESGAQYELQLPSGRKLSYYDVQALDRKTYRATQTIGGNLMRLWGGKIIENLVQSAARDVFALCLLNLEHAQLGRIVWHVHDEVILECEKDISTEDVVRVMERDVEVMEGLPIGAEANEADFYDK